jgi:hypothetical protein
MDLLIEGRTLPIKYYAWPHRGYDMEITINGEKCPARVTKWGAQHNTYWVFRNVSMLVREHLKPGSRGTLLDMPDNFGSPVPPQPRKKYYVLKKDREEGVGATATG